MSKIVKFKKEHVSGIEKGAIKTLDDNHALRLEKDGFITDATEEDLEAYNLKLRKKKVVSTIEAAKAEANSSNSECSECGDNPECEECKEKEGVIEKTYHVLTEEDIDANEMESAGFEVGDEVEINEEGELVLDEEGKLIGKDLGKRIGPTTLWAKIKERFKIN